MTAIIPYVFVWIHERIISQWCYQSQFIFLWQKLSTFSFIFCFYRYVFFFLLLSILCIHLWWLGRPMATKTREKSGKQFIFWDGEREKQWKMSCNEKYMEKLKKNSPYFYRVSAPVRVWNRVRYHKPKWQEVFVFCFVSLSSNFSFML